MADSIYKNIIIEDTTLREGEQSPGVALSCDEKLSILKALELINIPMIEVGIASMGGQEKEFIRQAVEMKTKAVLISWNRAKLDDIKQSIDCGLKAIHIGTPVSDIHLNSSLKKDRAWLYSEINKLTGYCKERGMYVSVSAEDSSRTDRKVLIEYIKHLKNAGVDRVRLSDTLGLFNPFDFYDTVKSVIEETGIDVQVHAHNDLGLAMANVLAAIKAGAKYVQATINGWGERVGLVSLELVVITMKRLFGIDTGIDTTKFPEVCSLVAELFGRQIPPWQPVVGKDIFIQESGIHVAATVENPAAFETFPPEWIGKQHLFAAGKHSGSKGIQHVFREEGKIITREEASDLLPEIRKMAIRNKRCLNKDELLEVYSGKKND